MREHLPGILIVAFIAAVSGRHSTPAAPARFRQVGVIECFYGTPWSHRDRIDMLEFMGGMGMNAYYYAPKDDPYHRKQWRDPYPGDQLGQFRELLAVSKKYKIDFYFGLSPGLSIVYSEPKDYQALAAKLDTMIALGFTHFALFFDDVPPVLTNEQDRVLFGSLASAQAFLLGKIRESLSAAGADLVVCPTTYTNAWGDRGYLAELGKNVDAKISFFWTGIDVVAPEFTSAQARQWAGIMSRNPLIWANYPANDFAPWRVFLGPWRGCAPDLPEVADGIVANPMSQAHASMIPLATLAEYARDPANYDPERAMVSVLEKLFGRQAAARMRSLIEVYGSPAWQSGMFDPLYVPGEPIRGQATLAAVRRVRDTLSTLKGAAFRSDRRLSRVVAELEPVIEGTGRKLLEYVNSPSYRAGEQGIEFRSELDRISAGAAARPVEIDGKLNEWHPTGWRSLICSGGQLPGRAEVAFTHDDANLYAAVRVETGTGGSAAGGADSGGTRRIYVIADLNPSGAGAIGADDPILRYVVEPASKAELRTLRLSPFMSRLLAGSAGLTFEGFLDLTAAPPGQPELRFAEKSAFASSSAEGRYAIELALPVGSQKHIRLALVLVDPGMQAEGGCSITVRNYPLNPSTFADIELN